MPLLPMLGDPNANRSLIQWVGWAGQWPEGRTPTPKPSRKKEKRVAILPCRKKERVAILAQAVSAQGLSPKDSQKEERTWKPKVGT